MKISQGIFSVVCIAFAIQIALVDCDQALGTLINSLNLNTIANRDRLLGGSRIGGINNPAASFQIWIQGISTTDFNAVASAVSGAGCTMLSSNIGNNAAGLPHWNYVVARIRCNTNTKWQNLVYDQAFYSRVAYTERSYTIDALPASNSGSGVNSCNKRFSIPKRIAMSPGKVNQHSVSTGFATDPDGVSGSTLDKLTYCRKWFPQTTSFQNYQEETITTWRDSGNTGGPYRITVTTIECVQPPVSCKRSEFEDVDLNEFTEQSQEEYEKFKKVYEDMIRSIAEFNPNNEFKQVEERQTPPNPYVCSQVNEGSYAYLSCPTGKVIKRIEFASYGQAPALDHCREGSRPRYASCHSPYSDYKVSQQCCGRSSCSVQAADAFFGNTYCSGSKTLRIKAVCDIPSKAECTTPICGTYNENSFVSLTCPTNQTITKIGFAVYGTSPTTQCVNDYSFTPGSCFANMANTKTQIENVCKGRNTCSFTAGNAMFGNPCSGTKKLVVHASCATHNKPYEFGFEQITSMQPSSNAAWTSTYSRTWTNYLENMGWTPAVDYYNALYGGTYYLLDHGIQENHPEFRNYSNYPYVTTRIRRLPNVMHPDPAKQYDGFVDPDLLAYFGEDPYLEKGVAHGTTNAAILMGNILGLTRNLPLYSAKVGSPDIGFDIQAFTTAMGSINQLSGSPGHKRPSVVVSPFNFVFLYGYCYADRVYATPPEPHCAQGIVDELATAYSLGIIVVLPSNNGFNIYEDLFINPQTGYPFGPGEVPFPYSYNCDPQPKSATPIDICYTAKHHHNETFNVWGLYWPVYGNDTTNFKPFIVAAHDSNNRISRWRDIVYSEEDPNWGTPWWSMGSSNVGECVDFSSFGVRFSRTAANYYAIEDGHYFADGYRDYPYVMSGTSFATATAAAAAMYTYARYYNTQPFNGQTVEYVRNYLKTNANTNNDDFDFCRNNYWHNLTDMTSYPRIKFA